MSEILCSVVIPARNCLMYLPAAIDSIRAQQRSDLEIIVVDDGSTDGTGDWVRSQDGDIRLIRTEGIGPGAARNRGVAAAKGALIAFLDADDVWWPAKLDRQIAFHRTNEECGMSFTDYLHVLPDGLTRGTCFAFWKHEWSRVPNGDYFRVQNPLARLLSCNVVGTSTVVCRRNVFERVGGFSEAISSAEDWDLWLRLADNAGIACSAAVTTSYLMRPGSETANRSKRIAAMQEIIARYADRNSHEMKRAISVAQARVDVAEAEHALAQGDVATATRRHLRALYAVPDARTARAIAGTIKDVVQRRFAGGVPT